MRDGPYKKHKKTKSTINAMQEDYASNRRLNMMHVDHAMPI
jgi:hypothetical protein